MPAVSSLQVAPLFTSSQHVLEGGAFTWTVPPSGSLASLHTVPGSLQDVPLLQRKSTQLTSEYGGMPPQHSSLVAHALSVTEQPVAGVQTLAPNPRSVQMRVAQSLPVVQGLPSSPRPPVLWKQRPGVPSVLEQRPLQQSSLAVQMSPVAWQK